MKRTKYSKIEFMLGAALLGTLTGCVYGSRQRVVYVPPPPDYVAAGVVLQDDYVYYPGYQVYYSSNRRQYVYQEGRSWVSRPAPPRVSADVLLASPSVRLDFHDAPAVHHAAVVRQYPKHCAPPASSPSHGQEKKDNGKGNDRADH
jgi:hypothetical protein